MDGVRDGVGLLDPVFELLGETEGDGELEAVLLGE